jgi:hypothetical protein
LVSGCCTPQDTKTAREGPAEPPLSDEENIKQDIVARVRSHHSQPQEETDPQGRKVFRLVPPPPNSEAAGAMKKEEDDALAGFQNFKGIKLGIGPSVSFDVGGKPRIEGARVIDGRVRVEREQSAIPRILLESHYFFTPALDLPGLVPRGRWGFGPFVGLQSSTEDILEAYALGVMIGFRPLDELRGSFNLGLAAVIDPNKLVLGDNVHENRPPPGGETEARTKEETSVGVGIVASFSW